MEVPKMKARIQEALRRRHQKEDDGFTLIELLVVILIIAILAAVGIVALLSALDSGKKSAAKTSLRSAMSAVKSVQVGAGTEDFTGLGADLAAAVATLNGAEPDLNFIALVATGLPASSEVNDIGVISTGTATAVILQSRDSSGHCFFVEMHTDAATEYGSATASSSTACPVVPSVAYTTSQTDGWAAP